MKPRLGTGWWGRGPPILVPGHPGEGPGRPLWDGGGLCSPGRWSPRTRRLPGGVCSVVKTRLVRCILECEKHWKGGIKGCVARLMTSKEVECPFPEEILKQLQEGVDQDLREWGADPSIQSGDVVHDIRTRSVQSFLWL